MAIAPGWLRFWSTSAPSRQVAALLKAPATAAVATPAPPVAEPVAPPLASAALAVATQAPGLQGGGFDARTAKLAAAQADLVRARSLTTVWFDLRVQTRARVAELVARVSTSGKAQPGDVDALDLARRNLEKTEEQFRRALERQKGAVERRDALVVTGPI